MSKQLQEGLLFFDNDKKRTAAERITRVAKHYANKFGHRPNTCHVNADQFADWFSGVPTGTIQGVVVAPSRIVDTDYFWIGVA